MAFPFFLRGLRPAAERCYRIPFCFTTAEDSISFLTTGFIHPRDYPSRAGVLGLGSDPTVPSPSPVSFLSFGPARCPVQEAAPSFAAPEKQCGISPRPCCSLLPHSVPLTGVQPEGCCIPVIVGHCKAIICGPCRDWKGRKSQQGWLVT